MIAFNKEKHVKEVEFDANLQTVISFDFNVAPCTATISQEDYHKTKKHFLHEIRLGDKNNKADVYLVCENIKNILPLNVIPYVDIRGDATGKNQSALTRGDLMAYTIIQEELNLSLDNFRTLKGFNISHKNSFTICNDTLRKIDFAIHPRMRHTIIDLETVEYDGIKIMKAQAEKQGNGHLLDCVRYDLHEFLDE
jgi:hypothetical protein